MENIKKFTESLGINRIRSLATRKRVRRPARAPGPGHKHQVSWSMHALTKGSLRLQAPSLKLDMKDIIGYSLIKKKEKRTYAKLNASRPRTVVTRRKYCSRNCSALEATDPGHKSPFEPKAASIKRQASSPKQQASSSKPQASSSMILDPRYI